MTVAGLVLAGLAALVHVYIFYLESIVWTSDKARAIFGTGSREQAEVMKDLAFNQGFYNLFLALVTAIGIVATAVGAPAVGLTWCSWVRAPWSPPVWCCCSPVRRRPPPR